MCSHWLEWDAEKETYRVKEVSGSNNVEDNNQNSAQEGIDNFHCTLRELIENETFRENFEETLRTYRTAKNDLAIVRDGIKDKECDEGDDEDGDDDKGDEDDEGEKSTNAKVSRRQVEKILFDTEAACSNDDDSSGTSKGDDDDEGDGQCDDSMIDDNSQDNNDHSHHRQVDNDYLRDYTNTGAGREDVAAGVDGDEFISDPEYTDLEIAKLFSNELSTETIEDVTNEDEIAELLRSEVRESSNDTIEDVINEDTENMEVTTNR
mmetsp:Transcript_22121/g.53599  ORF Transcript_22121/g.53599 Transcript_22121/m.53599 type:complete len:264 (-) Transcript_22121:61-852(-)